MEQKTSWTKINANQHSPFIVLAISWCTEYFCVDKNGLCNRIPEIQILWKLIYSHISSISGKDIDILRNRSFFLSLQLTFCPQIVKGIMNK